MEEHVEPLHRLRDRLRDAVRGRDDVIDLLLIALVADGHVLLEDYPGSGKTTLAKALGMSIVDDREDPGLIEGFRRIQFTPDLLPSDVTGTSVFDRTTGRFDFRPGPLFAHVVLADEINRTSPKVQAALLEAMAEKQVTVDNQTHTLDDVFFVIATQNPLDVAGTFPLPGPQLDRFLFKIRMTYLEREDEIDVLRSMEARRAPNPVRGMGRSDLLRLRERAREVYVHDAIHEALVDSARAIRSDERVVQGVSTRSLVLAVPAVQARALIRGRDYVLAEDLEALLPFVFRHRMEVGGGIKLESVLSDALRPVMERLARRALREAS
ncbi:MAG: AAA family ATPase [Myxococcota bacterium]